MAVASLGLDVENIDMQLRSADQKIEVVRFTGKIKKEEIHSELFLIQH